MKVAYIGEHNESTGTYYRQRITVTPEEFDELNAALTGQYNSTASSVREKAYNHIGRNAPPLLC